MADIPPIKDNSDNNAQVAKGAGLAFLGRLGALIELVGLPLFTYAYGSATLGLFFTLWGVFRITSGLTEFAMTTALQRFVPKKKDPAYQYAVLKVALVSGLSISSVVALLFTVFASQIASVFNASEADAAHITSLIQIYCWVLVPWALVEIFTASVRAQRTFGPEIRIRIFYEQLLRIVAAMIFAWAGYQTFGLFFAHLFSVLIAAFLAAKLSSRFYDFSHILKTPFDGALAREIWAFAIPMIPANLVKRLVSELPVVILNMLLPGAQGAEAAGIYGIARKISSVLLVVRQSFEYVLAPFATHHHSCDEREELQNSFHFILRLTLTFLIPLATLLLLTREELLSLFAPEIMAAAPIIVILLIGRLVEGLMGPSPTLIEMIGNRWLPVINSGVGIFILIILHFVLIPEYGVAGAAISASIGLNLTALLNVLQCQFVYKYKPFSIDAFRPVCVALAMSVVMYFIHETTIQWGGGAAISATLASFFLSILISGRLGLSNDDLKHLGTFGRIIGGKRP